MQDEAGRKVETAVEARAGFLDPPVLVVLVVYELKRQQVARVKEDCCHRHRPS